MNARERRITVDEVYAYPGLFPAGTEIDDALVLRKGAPVESSENWKVRSELAEHRIVDPTILEPWRDHFPQVYLKCHDPEVVRVFDVETMIKIDQRIRFCRCVLHLENLPYDKEEIAVRQDHSWQYVSLLSNKSRADCIVQDPLDWLLMVSSLKLHSAAWFAAKCLSHARRADHISGQIANGGFQPEHELGLMREWMLFGETWSEAKFIINHSKSTITGKKQTKVLDNHRNSANEKKQKRAARRQEIVAEFAAQSNATHGALVREVQKYFRDNYDNLEISVTDRTIRDDLKKVGKTG